MVLCLCCHNIKFDGDASYWLLDAAPMAVSAVEGCPGCKFFLQSAILSVGQKSVASNFVKEGIRVFLRRWSDTDTRVDLHFVRFEAGYKSYGKVPLRLCTAYGFEQASFAESEESEAKLLGRLICPSSKDSECLDLAASWLQRCSRHHGGICRPLHDVPLPTRLVHIPRNPDERLQLRLTKGLTGQYVALSYCWGSGEVFKTTSAEYGARLDGFEAGMLPQTIQDAISVSRRFGFEYIWIDALCIIHGDVEDWAQESSRMSHIYGNAMLTLCADLARNNNDGILRPRKTLYSHKFGPSQELCLQTRAHQRNSMGWDQVPYEPLGQRGWALQERVLSARNLHFLDEQLAWECNTTVYLEEIRGRQTRQDTHFVTSKYRKYLKATSTAETEVSAVCEDHESDHLWRINAWLNVVQELSIRQFTVPSDKLPSLAGLASAIEVPYLGKYLAGIWENYAFLSLGWYARYSQIPQTTYRAPSWSWAATEGQLITLGYTWKPNPSLSEKADWDSWFEVFGPRLAGHHVLPKDPNNPKGEVKEGSYIAVNGYCRDIYIAEEPHETFEVWTFVRGDGEEAEALGFPGRKVHMDVRKHNCNSTSYFAEDLENPDAKVDPAVLKRFTCVQISREKVRVYPKTLALVLECLDGTDDSFKRVGLLAFDGPEANDPRKSEWRKRGLRIF